MTVAVALLTRDLRIHDNPVLAGAVDAAPMVLPLFCLDPGAMATSSPNRRHALAQALADLRSGLRRRGGDLMVRHGRPADVLAVLATRIGIAQVHLAADATPFAARRLRAIRQALGDGVEVVEHDAHVLVPAAGVTTADGGAYQVFTPYRRAWKDTPRRALVDPPARLELPPDVDVGDLPEPGHLADGAVSPDLPEVTETAALARARAFLTADAGDYHDARDDLAADRTSRLSPHLHFGTLSVRWLEEQLDRRKPGHDALHRQLAWRDYAHQLLAANPSMVTDDLRSRADRWDDDPEVLEAWKQGRTGYPVVDAGMRQLIAEGWMHNRARMTVASFLTKHLRVDWRHGAAHFRELLVDHDVATNIVSWQWVAGTGTDTRPNRMLNPIRQAERFDPAAAYVRRYVDELRDVTDDRGAREPWRLDGTLTAPDYPRPLVDHDDARTRFLAERGA